MELLLPVRHPERDFFACNIFDALPYFKDDMASMEHPVFSLSTKPDMRVLHYEHNGNSITIKPSYYGGLPTIYDKDILIYCASHLRSAILKGEEPNRRIRFTAYDFFISTNKKTDGEEYARFTKSLDRLQGTSINTNIRTGGYRIEEGFGIIDAWRVVKENDDGRVIAVEIKVSDWFYNSVISNEILTISQDYFRIRKPIERRIYEIARKHCGDQSSCKIGLDKLHKKIGTTAPLRKLRFQIKGIAETNHLPDYEISFSDDVVTFINRNTHKRTKNDNAEQYSLPLLKTATFEKARGVAPGWDIYALESEWRDWASSKAPPKRPDAAFIAFCRKKAGRTR
jgi:plasmid replication initiation protein